MECRAINAEEESGLLKEQLEDLKKQLTEVLSSCSFVDSWSLHSISLPTIYLIFSTLYPLMMPTLFRLSLYYTSVSWIGLLMPYL